MNDSIKLMQQYIEFLGKYIDNISGYLHIHGMNASEEDIKKGKKLRNKMRNFKELEGWNYLIKREEYDKNI